MLTRTVIIPNRLGLHLRAAHKLVTLAAGFGSRIELVNGDKQADAKSIMEILMIEGSSGAQIEVRTSGDDAEQALESITALIERGFDET